MKRSSGFGAVLLIIAVAVAIGWVAENKEIAIGIAAVILLLVILLIARNRSKAKKRAAAAAAARQAQIKEKEKQEKERIHREEIEAAERARQREKAIAAAAAALDAKDQPVKEFVFHRRLGDNIAAYSYMDVLIDPAPGLDYGKVVLGRPLTLRADDSDVLVYQDNGLLLGTMRDNKLRRMVHDWQRNGDPIISVANATDDEECTVQLAMVFYADPLALAERRGSKQMKLSGNKGADAQEEIQSIDAGQVCDLSFDVSKEKYEVTPLDGFHNIGYLSCDDVSEDALFVVSDIEENDSEKYDVWGYIV